MLGLKQQEIDVPYGNWQYSEGSEMFASFGRSSRTFVSKVHYGQTGYCALQERFGFLIAALTLIRLFRLVAVSG